MLIIGPSRKFIEIKSSTLYLLVKNHITMTILLLIKTI